jgi:hypothetical protein
MLLDIHRLVQTEPQHGAGSVISLPYEDTLHEAYHPYGLPEYDKPQFFV